MLFLRMISMMMFLFLALSANAQQSELIDRTFTGTSKEATQVAAKKEIQDKAFQIISEEIIKELIGEERFSKNKTLIQNTIIKNSARYIPFSKPGALTPAGEEFKMSVEMKLSLKDLKQMLQDRSLLNENDSIPVVLPVVTWVDRVEGRSYRWWAPIDKNTPSFLVKEARLLEDNLRTAFQKNNFFAIKPIDAGLALSVPTAFQTEKISREDSAFFAQYFNAPVLIDGQVLLTKLDGKAYRIEVKLTAIQVSNGRAIADVARRFDTEPGTFESAVDKKVREVMEGTANDLASQVLDAWQRGSVGTSVLRLTLRGRNSLPLIENLKEKIRSQITQVKNIRERLVSSELVSFEVDTSASPEDLSKRLESLQIDGKKLSKISENQSEIILQWEK